MAFIPGPALLDFLSHLLHTKFITDGRQLQMNQDMWMNSDKNTSKILQKE